MPISTADYRQYDPVSISTYGPNAAGSLFAGVRGSLATTGGLTSNGARYVQFVTHRPYPIARWWWLNGATVGTNFIQAGIYTKAGQLIAISPKTLSAGTVNEPQYVPAYVGGANQITNGSSSTDAQTYTTGSVVMKAGRLYLMSVENSHASSAAAVSSITQTGGGAPTFASRSTVQFNGTLNRVSIWSCVPTVDFSGTLDITITGSANTGACWSLAEFLHVDTTTNDGIVQNATSTGNSTTPLATLSAYGSVNNATFGAFGVGAANAGTPSTGYFEVSDNTAATPAQALQTVFRLDNDTTVDETITSAQWGACAVEIKALSTASILIPAMTGYLALWANGNTATIMRNISGSMQPAQSQETGLTNGLPQTATMVSGAFLPVFGITRRATP